MDIQLKKKPWYIRHLSYSIAVILPPSCIVNAP